MERLQSISLPRIPPVKGPINRKLLLFRSLCAYCPVSIFRSLLQIRNISIIVRRYFLFLCVSFSSRREDCLAHLQVLVVQLEEQEDEYV